jgi:hypothetical protein
MVRSSLCFALFVSLGHSDYIPAQVREMASPAIWKQNMNYGSSEKHFSFEGFLKDGSAIRFDSPLYEDSAGEYVLPDTARTLWSKAADNVRRRTADFDSLIGIEIEGTRNGNDTVLHPASVHDGHWLFPAISGKLSIYSHSPGGEDYAYMEIPGRGIEKYQDSVLRQELGKKKASSDILNRQSLCKVGAGTLFVGGGLLLAVGILSSDEETTDQFGHNQHEFNASPLIGVGLGAMAVGIVPLVMSQGQFERAIRAYNE